MYCRICLFGMDVFEALSACFLPLIVFRMKQDKYLCTSHVKLKEVLFGVCYICSFKYNLLNQMKFSNKTHDNYTCVLDFLFL